jgi:hypothetical protein
MNAIADCALTVDEIEDRINVARLHRLEQIQERPVLQKLAREARIGTEQQRPVAANDTGVEVGHRHRRRTHRSLAVDLRFMTARDVRRVAAQPDAADGKAAIPSAFRDLGFLQQRQRLNRGQLAGGRYRFGTPGIGRIQLSDELGRRTTTKSCWKAFAITMKSRISKYRPQFFKMYGLVCNVDL